MIRSSVFNTQPLHQRLHQIITLKLSLRSHEVTHHGQNEPKYEVAESLISLFQSRGPSYVSTREIIKHDHQDRELRYSIAMHPIRKGDCCGGSWTKWGAPVPCGLLATYISRVRMIQSRQTVESKKERQTDLENLRSNDTNHDANYPPGFQFPGNPIPIQTKNNDKAKGIINE